jgi:hypothetical protein
MAKNEKKKKERRDLWSVCPGVEFGDLLNASAEVPNQISPLLGYGWGASKAKVSEIQWDHVRAEVN